MAEDKITTTTSIEIPIAAAGAIRLTGDGIVIQNLTKPKNFVRIVSRGIEVSQDDGKTWTEVLTSEGIKTGFLGPGVINTQNISVMNGEDTSFRWDQYGLSAYGFSDLPDEPFDLTTFVRMDKYGLYGIKQGGDYVVTSLEDIKEKAHFGVTWDGFFIKNSYTDGYVSITSDDDFQVVSNGIERIKIGAIDRVSRDHLKYGIIINNAAGERVFETNDEGNLIITGTIYAHAGEFTGTVHAAAGEFDGTITARDGSIGGFTIGDHLYSGEIGTPGSIYLSSGIASTVPIAGSSGGQNWVITAGDKFGVTSEGIVYAENAFIRGTIHAEDGEFTGVVNARGGTFSDKIMVGREHDKYIIIDSSGADSLIASSDYMKNTSAGWAINGYGDAIFNNVSVRGAIKTAVFEYSEIEAVGGAFLFRPSSSIKEAHVDGNDLILKVEKPLLFRQNEWVKLSNYNTEADGQDIINDGGLTYVFKIGNQPTSDRYVRLLDAAEDFFEIVDFNIDKDNKYIQEAGMGELVRAYNSNFVETIDDEEGFYSYQLEINLDNNKQFFVSYDYEKYVKKVTTDTITVNIFQESPTSDLNIEEDIINEKTEAEMAQPYIANITDETEPTEEIRPEESSIDVSTLEIRQPDSIITYEIRYLGNLAILDKTKPNTAEPFVIAVILRKTTYQAATGTTTIEDFNNPITRIYTEAPQTFNLQIEEYNTQTVTGKYNVTELEGGSIISFGYYDNDSVYEGGIHNYGIGINSSDNYVNLPERAISLFETKIHPEQSVKVTYDYKGILGTLPRLGTDLVSNDVYNGYMAGKQGIYTNNMYIGDNKQYLAFYEDAFGKHLRIVAKDLSILPNDEADPVPVANTIIQQYDQYALSSSSNEYIPIQGNTWSQTMPTVTEGTYLWQRTHTLYLNNTTNDTNPIYVVTADGTAGKDGEDAITVEIDSSAGNVFLHKNISTTLTCTVIKGNGTDITDQVTRFTWIKKDVNGVVDSSWSRPLAGRSITLTEADVDSKAIFVCEVEF